MINPEKYATKIMVNNPNGYLLADYIRMIEEIQKDAYNQAIDDVFNMVDAGSGDWIINKESFLKLKK